MKNLILYNGPNSPFGRKTKIAALIHDIPIEEKIIKVQESEFLVEFMIPIFFQDAGETSSDNAI